MQAFNKNHAFFHQSILITLVLLFAGIQTLFAFSFTMQIVFFLTVTLTIGVFHGMLDIALLKFTTFQQSGFLAVYAVLALSALLFFLFIPNAAFVVLLLLSIWHFGEAQRSDDVMPIQSKMQQVFKRFMLGATPLAAPYMMANQSLYAVLVTLLPGTVWLSITWSVWGVIAWAWLAAFTAHLIGLAVNKVSHPDPAALLEILAVWLSFSLLSPLIAFSLYFGAYHAVRHIRDVLSNTYDIKNHKTQMIWIGIIILMMLTLVIVMLNNQIYLNNLQISSAAILLRASFILLVVITLPHTFLISIWRNNLYKSL